MKPLVEGHVVCVFVQGGASMFDPILFTVAKRRFGSRQKLAGCLCLECWWILITDTFRTKIEVDSYFSAQVDYYNLGVHMANV